jgi:hypothetical protein
VNSTLATVSDSNASGGSTPPPGLTLSGLTCRDDPILYADKSLRDGTGYGLAELSGENPRLFQDPGTEPEALDTLHEAIGIRAEATVELSPRRQPVPEPCHRRSCSRDSGMIASRFGVQSVVGE